MERILVDNLINEVRITLDENAPQSSYLYESSDNIELDDIIRSKVVDAVRLALEDAPLSFLEPKEVTSPTIKGNDDGSGKITLPEDFLRLAGLKLNGWNRGVSIVYNKGSEMDYIQRNKYTRGTATKPVCVFSHTDDGERCIEYFVAAKNDNGYDHTIVDYHYVAIPSIEVDANGGGEFISFPNLLHFAIVNYCAGLVLTSRGEQAVGNNFITLAQNSFK